MNYHEYNNYDEDFVKLNFSNVGGLITTIYLDLDTDYSNDFESELADVFCYSCFDEGEKCIVKLKYGYIKHNTTIAFPSVIFVKELFETIPYTITSKNSPTIVSGEIKVTDNVKSNKNGGSDSPCHR